MPILLFLLLVLHLLRPLSAVPLERAALLRLRDQVDADPSGHLSTWDAAGSSKPHCSWRFVTCDPVSGRVVGLDLSAAAPSLRLRRLPASLRRLSRLRRLVLPCLALRGPLPPWLPSLPHLEVLDLSRNRFTGGIPGGIPRRLQRLDLSGNALAGAIPSGLGDCRQLRSLDLSSNSLEGAIPPEIGRLRKLELLDVSRNRLAGTIPAEIGDCLELAEIVLSDARNGEQNAFAGSIDSGITRLPKLRKLWAPTASLDGRIPQDWGSCASLEVVQLGGNLLRGGLPSFADCRRLRYLNLSSNELTGHLDPRLPLPCLDVFDVSGNQLSGEIPKFVPQECGSSPRSRLAVDGNALRRFGLDSRPAVVHDFGRNDFTGGVPALPIVRGPLGEKDVYVLALNGNKLSGSFPQHLLCESEGGSARRLVLDISGNLLSGVIPPEIGSGCGSLMVLDASGNRIGGIIPREIGLCNALEHLDLSRNRLQGRVPGSFCLLSHLKHLYLAGNELVGDDPPSLCRLPLLEAIDRPSNSRSGVAPSKVIALRNNLSVPLVDDSKNSRRIISMPVVANKTLIHVLDMYHNRSSWPTQSSAARVISSFVHSARMRGRSLESSEENSPPGKSGFSSIEIASISSASAIVSVLFALIIIYIYTRKCVPNAKVQAAGKKEVTVFVNIGASLTYENVVRATGNFNASNCIGSGGFGATYKAEIAPGVIVAIKKLFVGKIQGVQQFHAETKTLGRWRHPNLVTLIGFHVSESEMFLIYNYLPGGNLENFIHNRHKRPVDWRVLHKIALDVACALAYLHDTCVPRILHRDVKPSNILLDNDFNAFLSDFGLARLLGNSETHATTGVAGTFGYVAPEYAMTCRVSDKADVYSYGVVLLELLSDKKALDPSFSPYGNGFNIVTWATMLLKKGKAREFFTEGLWDVGPSDDLIETLHLALKCTIDSLTNRPTMKEVVQKLKRIQP